MKTLWGSISILCKAMSLLAFCCLSTSVFAFEAQVSIGNKSVTFSSAEAGVATIAAVIVDEEGSQVFSKSVGGASLIWQLEDGVADGVYKYQVTLSDTAPASRSREREAAVRPVISKHSGALMIKDGNVLSPSTEEATEESNTEESNEEGAFSSPSSTIESIAQVVVEWLIPSAHADIQQLDDVIIDGSLCVGQDCVNGENFGFDTIVVKENNVRLFFNDTSNTASFPNNDWRILANDSANGGGNFFAIEDATAGRQIFTIDAGAPTNSLYVDRNGRIGVGTATPATLLDLVNGNTPTVRLNQDASSGWSAQAWDLGGNEIGFFVRDVTSGSKLPFRIERGAPNNSLYVDSAGNVGIGQANPQQALHVMGNAIISGNLELGSSRYIKDDIKNLGLSQAMQAFKALEPVMFKYKHSPDKQSIGFIAEDVPDLVATDKRNSLRPMDIVAVLTKVVQEQQKTIDDLSKKLDSLLDEN